MPNAAPSGLELSKVAFLASLNEMSSPPAAHDTPSGPPGCMYRGDSAAITTSLTPGSTTYTSRSAPASTPS